MRAKLVLGLSGGVDSAVAAQILMEHYDVTCLWLSIGPCAAGEADAAAVAARLGLPFRTADISDPLEREVCAPFAADYLAGRTPLPCARCNPLVKFPALCALADELGAPYVATGHYARTAPGPNGRTLLLKGGPANDQSYMLSRLPQDILRRAVFPLGERAKSLTRREAAGTGLPVADKPDSMEICFVPDGDYAAWLDRRGTAAPEGDFVDPAGSVLGRHRGIHHYTVGQGRGLGVSGPHRYFVSALDVEHDRVVLSDGSDLMASRVFCTRPNWISIDGLTGPTEVTVRLRHSRTETPATIRAADGGVLVETHEPVRAPTPGQLAAFYDGDVVVGSAWIEKKLDEGAESS